ncbi:GNAT family N-acetyltransferase [Salirhabdus sp. Marseille-P4669]|uniref:GNAT family N-acetyltransferase n=1 Tax=Salirhabdus sp. Marseille-P4669 TaxID=2042310 RepID=UPI000C7B320F|nr:GNAT family N-acetyltransferase [Salirhabdus sp. Marseille-P4669]
MIIRPEYNSEAYPMDILLLADPSQKLIEKYLLNGQCYVAEQNSIFIGAYVLLAKTCNTIEIMNIAISEKYQGKGIGKKLIKHAVTVSKEKGFTRIEIGTGNSSIGQLALYQKCGFRFVEIEKDFFLKNYEEPIFENGIPCLDMIRLRMQL